MNISGWCRANWITSSGKSLVEPKVPKVLLGHCGEAALSGILLSAHPRYQRPTSGTSWETPVPCAYHARAGIGHTPLVRHPLVVGTLLVREGAQESPADVGHGVDTDG